MSKYLFLHTSMKDLMDFSSVGDAHTKFHVFEDEFNKTVPYDMAIQA